MRHKVHLVQCRFHVKNEKLLCNEILQEAILNKPSCKGRIDGKSPGLFLINERCSAAPGYSRYPGLFLINERCDTTPGYSIYPGLFLINERCSAAPGYSRCPGLFLINERSNATPVYRHYMQLQRVYITLQLNQGIHHVKKNK